METLTEVKNMISKRNIVVFVVLGIVVFSLLVFLGDYKQIIKSISKFDFAIIPLLVLCTLMNMIIRFVKWEYFLRYLGIRVSLTHSSSIFISGFTMAITPAKIGEVLKSYLLKQSDRIDMSKSIMIVVAERVTDVIGLLLLSLLGIFSLFIRRYWYGLVVIFILLCLLLFLLRSKRAFLWFRSVLLRLPLLKNYAANLGEVYNSSEKLLTFKPLTIASMLSVVSWFFECLALFLLVNSFGYKISIFEATFVFSFSSIFGSILVLPGGLGAAEASLMALLIALGIPKSISALSTIIIRVCTLWFGIFIGVISLWLFWRIIPRRKINVA